MRLRRAQPQTSPHDDRTQIRPHNSGCFICVVFEDDTYNSMQNTVFTHISNISGDTYRNPFEQWDSISPEMQKHILAIYMDIIERINS